MNIKVYNSCDNKMPEYKTVGSAGMDLMANLETPIILKPFERKLIPTGIHLELPLGIEAQVRARSGLAINSGLSLVNGIGTIDSDYRGEIKVILINLGENSVEINNGDRIAQIIFSEYIQPILVEVDSIDDLDATERGKEGFGHTGI